ncbi:hypothetical protein EU537_04530 [Candidatus Thorarchaeota archaeon]|nr:MAG: hypothetical protein EU537_04530 [Candidatus Thorarchaeota archaeon]
MKIGSIEVTPVAAESMGVRSLSTFIKTPDVSILLDPSAALAMRMSLEPHPQEYIALYQALIEILEYSERADIITISHYHYDHVRPSLENYRYNFSSPENFQATFRDKRIIAKDNRDNINPSQRRRGYYFEKDVGDIAKSISWADGETHQIGDTTIRFTEAIPHGPEGIFLGFVISTLIEYDGQKVLFAPDVQGPVSRNTLSLFLSLAPDFLLVGGPPIYINKFSKKDRRNALFSATTLATSTNVMVIDHHLQRSKEWEKWLAPVMRAARAAENRVLTAAEVRGQDNRCLEAQRIQLYEIDPPSMDFIAWTDATEKYKMTEPPPIPEIDYSKLGGTS